MSVLAGEPLSSEALSELSKYRLCCLSFKHRLPNVDLSEWVTGSPSQEEKVGVLPFLMGNLPCGKHPEVSPPGLLSCSTMISSSPRWVERSDRVKVMLQQFPKTVHSIHILQHNERIS